MTNETSQVHHADCGDVGETGEHGELGSNTVGATREAAVTTETKPAAAAPANPLVTHNTGANTGAK
jgi:hypothetical protein